MNHPGVSRRQLLLGAGAATTLAASPALALSRSQVKHWDITTDILIAGSGAAGMAAAIEARWAGAEVLLVEKLTKLGGSSAMSGGVIYAGGGTALQKAVGVEDSAEAMYNFIVAAGSKHPHLDKIQLYCERSVAHFDWLVEQGVPYPPKLTKAKGLPFGDESLYYSGNELAWPLRDIARPAPRGHVPGVPGMTGGRRLMEALITSAQKLGARLETGVGGHRLIIESDGRVVGIEVEQGSERKTIHARRGVILACGGFIHNREMVKLYAPELYDCSVPWANAGDLGMGIQMGMGVGAAALRMNQGFAIGPIYPPENAIAGIIVNQQGQRFVSEESYHAVAGHATTYHQAGISYLVTDRNSSLPEGQDNRPLLAQADSIARLEKRAGFPAGALQVTVSFYNQNAKRGEDPLFHKSRDYLRPLSDPPFRVYDLRVDSSFFTSHTFGGLHTSINSEVIDVWGQPIPGLYAAGRTTSGLPSAPYIASGISVGDCTFFGRQAGVAAAAQEPAA